MADPKQFVEAVWEGNLSAVEAMLAAGADPNAPAEPDLQPPLHLAIEQQRVEIVRRLIAAGASVNRAHGQGWTPLVHAVDIESDVASQAGLPHEQISTELVELLLASGAQPTERAVELAATYGNYKALALLTRDRRDTEPGAPPTDSSGNRE